jgi:hypothetical protein
MERPEQRSLFWDCGQERASASFVTLTSEEVFLEKIRDALRQLACGRSVVVSGNDSKAVAALQKIAPANDNWWGLVFQEMGWQHVGYTRATDPKSHGRQIKTWRWRGRA